MLVDFVPNHTSNQHPWFARARSAGGGTGTCGPTHPPVGARRITGCRRSRPPAAWTLDEPTGQYYLHSYTTAQPDLNWHNAEVRAAMSDVLRFFLDRGVDGFRIDAAHRLIKDPTLAGNPADVAGAAPLWHPAAGGCATSTSPACTLCCVSCGRSSPVTAVTGCCSARSGSPIRPGRLLRPGRRADAAVELRLLVPAVHRGRVPHRRRHHRGGAAAWRLADLRPRQP